jgi:hypothetical protein
MPSSKAWIASGKTAVVVPRARLTTRVIYFLHFLWAHSTSRPFQPTPRRKPLPAKILAPRQARTGEMPDAGSSAVRSLMPILRTYFDKPFVEASRGATSWDDATKASCECCRSAHRRRLPNANAQRPASGARHVTCPAGPAFKHASMAQKDRAICPMNRLAVPRFSPNFPAPSD